MADDVVSAAIMPGEIMAAHVMPGDVVVPAHAEQGQEKLADNQRAADNGAYQICGFHGFSPLDTDIILFFASEMRRFHDDEKDPACQRQKAALFQAKLLGKPWQTAGRIMPVVGSGRTGIDGGRKQRTDAVSATKTPV